MGITDKVVHHRSAQDAESVCPASIEGLSLAECRLVTSFYTITLTLTPTQIPTRERGPRALGSPERRPRTVASVEQELWALMRREIRNYLNKHNE